MTTGGDFEEVNEPCICRGVWLARLGDRKKNRFYDCIFFKWICLYAGILSELEDWTQIRGISPVRGRSPTFRSSYATVPYPQSGKEPEKRRTALDQAVRSVPAASGRKVQESFLMDSSSSHCSRASLAVWSSVRIS